MKIVFFGTPSYVLPVLKTIHKEFVTGPGRSPIAAVVTQSPKPLGRKKTLTYSPVDKWGHEHGVPIYYSAEELIENTPDATIGILASYGEIIRKEVINLFPQGILVVHPSLLPKYRGASPVPAAIANGDELTGVSIIKMDEKVDHGPVITQFREQILPTDTSDILRNRLFEKSAKVITEMLTPYAQGKIKLKIQNEKEATFTKIMKREDGFVDLLKTPPIEIERFIRAMSSWPGAWTLVKLNPTDKTTRRLKLLGSHVEDGKLILDLVQLEGKDPVSWKQFKEGYNAMQFA
ncbi:MAG: methionyl-tRNA formyltransferase, methionyl-tRNA formyltransferase [Microgenomates group bacterium GW2011_GWC1_41_20]|uniref:methionyl-tRNA formyltransferase n=4 Tax=Candidatus Woeseibacteriota TaxID=1752722 RepID=A0A0G0QNK2_9BACT|nr:MAG: methionyl-tRNA formyltransferase, methionyl-tRNA formyltransferase [Candidatus Peregrinibacteria bacterium GW2011_GWE2_39_6]KKR41693.1 MAG: Methionyl-tRNA formyltransferase [Candidatus Woesebacteria bacterium GW2011_GWB1_40_12]KKR90204.1 MAG: Methionyl-tRNA formyltransferase [Candidatus Woesebacteria bacterium GW2011_GWD1_41_12]KKS00104.1 MAG: methionyl-tRNA formyltransferase, methionyl-tRNA formyltransferase [Microgenomates group bacterium GW2011_GWC1_41_20]KKS02790.1 MAG: Methionyl-tR